MNNIFDESADGGTLPNEDLMQQPDLAQDYNSSNSLSGSVFWTQDLGQQDSLNIDIDSANSWNTESNYEHFGDYSSINPSEIADSGTLEWQNSNPLTVEPSSPNFQEEPLNSQSSWNQNDLQGFTPSGDFNELPNAIANEIADSSASNFTGSVDHPTRELTFGIAMDAGKTESGDNVIWSTAEAAGGKYYNERTGEQVEPA